MIGRLLHTPEVTTAAVVKTEDDKDPVRDNGRKRGLNI